jgi:hypothetical protein
VGAARSGKFSLVVVAGIAVAGIEAEKLLQA